MSSVFDGAPVSHVRRGDGGSVLMPTRRAAPGVDRSRPEVPHGRAVAHTDLPRVAACARRLAGRHAMDPARLAAMLDLAAAAENAGVVRDAIRGSAATWEHDTPEGAGYVLRSSELGVTARVRADRVTVFPEGGAPVRFTGEGAARDAAAYVAAATVSEVSA